MNYVNKLGLSAILLLALSSIHAAGDDAAASSSSASSSAAKSGGDKQGGHGGIYDPNCGDEKNGSSSILCQLKSAYNGVGTYGQTGAKACLGTAVWYLGYKNVPAVKEMTDDAKDRVVQLLNWFSKWGNAVVKGTDRARTKAAILAVLVAATQCDCICKFTKGLWKSDKSGDNSGDDKAKSGLEDKGTSSGATTSGASEDDKQG